MYKKQTFKKHNKSDLIKNSKFNFYKYANIKRFNILSFEAKYPHLFDFKYGLYHFNKLQCQKESTKIKK